jgi:hypothetical protein
MVATAQDLHAQFLAILPRIERHARVYFRQFSQVTKEEAVADVVALSWKWFRRLVERGKDVNGFVSTLATYAAKAVQNGRRLCGQLKAKDVLSARAQRRHGFKVEPLPTSTRTSHAELYAVAGQRQLDIYEERLQDNTRTPPDEQAAFRLDFPAWLTTRTERDRRIIADMAVGERTKHLARRFGLSPARVSQLRREYRDDWLMFTGETQGLEPRAPDRCGR